MPATFGKLSNSPSAHGDCMKKEDKLTGITIVPGKGLGSAYFIGKGVEVPSKVSISRQDVGDQIMLFNAVREKAKVEYKALGAPQSSTPGLQTVITGIYEQILDDPSFIGQVVETISTKLFDLETSIRLVLNDFVSRFNASGTPYLKERSGDIVEVCEKLISYLHQDDGRKKTFLEPVVLIVLRMFTPSDILSYDKSRIQAVVSASGGRTSHAAILARAYSIPVVSDIRDLQKHIYPGEQIYVDADKATVYVRPNPASIARFSKQKTFQERLETLGQVAQTGLHARRDTNRGLGQCFFTRRRRRGQSVWGRRHRARPHGISFVEHEKIPLRGNAIPLLRKNIPEGRRQTLRGARHGHRRRQGPPNSSICRRNTTRSWAGGPSGSFWSARTFSRRSWPQS